MSPILDGVAQYQKLVYPLLIRMSISKKTAAPVGAAEKSKEINGGIVAETTAMWPES
jgi:hypothetical protein